MLGYSVVIKKSRNNYLLHGNNRRFTKMKLKELVNSTLPKAKSSRKRNSRKHSSGEPCSMTTSPEHQQCQGQDVSSPSHISYWINPNYELLQQGGSLDDIVTNAGNKDLETTPYMEIQDTKYEREEMQSSGGYGNETCETDLCLMTVPRERSKIKTNPWLPSPKTSPTNSSMTSPTKFPFDSSLTDEVFSQLRYHGDGYPHDASMSESGFYSFGTPEVFLEEPHFPVTTADKYQSKYGGDSCVSMATSASAEDYINDDESSISSDSDVEDDSEKSVRRIRPTISFDYERDVNDKLELCSSDISLSSSFESLAYDDITPSKETTYSVSQKDDVFTDYSSNGCSNFVLSKARSKECRSKANPLCDIRHDEKYYMNERNPAETDDRLKFIRHLDSQREVHKDNRMKYLQHLDRLKGIDVDSQQTSTNQNTEQSDVYTSCDYSLYRRQNSFSTVDSITQSLSNKLEKLRHDKLLVDDLVRKAREEEEMKRIQRMRIQREATIAMKQVLLKTLHGLQSQVSSQNERLQNSYDDILAFQYQRVKLHQRSRSVQA